MDKLNVVLTEYKALRDEIIDKFRLHLQIYSIYASALLIFYGLIFVNQKYDLILLIPFFAMALLFRFLWEQYVIRTINTYIHNEIEGKKIPKLIGNINKNEKNQEMNSTNMWMGWEHFWRENQHPRYYKYSLVVLFLFFSVIPAISYNIYSIFVFYMGMEKVSIAPMETHFFLFVLNCLIGWYIVDRIKRM